MVTTSQPESNSLGHKIESGLVKIVGFIVLIMIALLGIRAALVEPNQVLGKSMTPTLKENEWIITDKLTPRLSELKRGDVVVLMDPKDPWQTIIKRIVGLPTETIKLYQGAVYINGDFLQEPYLPMDSQTPGEDFLPENQEKAIPENQYFVLGDNRSNSFDSRQWGPIEKDKIIGKAWLRAWPLY